MSTHVTASGERVETLPPTAIAASLVALLALWLALNFAAGEGALIGLLSVALVLSARGAKRFEGGSSGVRLARLALFGIVAAMAVLRFRATDSDPIEMIFAWTVGLAFACEMTVQAWLARPLGGARGAIIVFASGMVMMAASNTYETRFIRFLAPLYMLLLALSLHSFSSHASSPRDAGLEAGGRRPARIESARIESARIESARMRRVALVLAIALGTIVHWGVWRNRYELNELGARLLREAPHPESVGLSDTPRLGATFGEEGGLGRVLRIEGRNVPGHWRALAFDTYDNGRWTPLVDKRKFEPFSQVSAPISKQNRAGFVKEEFHVERLLDDRGLVFAPLGAVRIAPQNGKLEWAADNGGPLRSVDPAPFPYFYDVATTDKNASYMSTHVAAWERARCLQVPDSLSPRARELARRIGKGRNAQEQVQAVQHFLMSHHAYSMKFNPGAGDPVSNFLLSDKAAHCEYFAASSVLLLRCLGVPSRYVIGYYAHESDGDGVTIVRSRDAHAWAESYVDGRWTTVDSTPGDGRPDKTGEPLPFWLHLRERLQDLARAVRNGFAQLRQSPREALCVVLICLAVAASIAWLRFKRRRKMPQIGFAYAAPDRDLQALALDFERLMHKRGLACPPQQTWAEYLATIDQQQTSDRIEHQSKEGRVETTSAPQAQVQQAQVQQAPVTSSEELKNAMRSKEERRAAQFVSAYNAARFGDAAHFAKVDTREAQAQKIEAQEAQTQEAQAREPAQEANERKRLQLAALRQLLRELETGRSDGITAKKELR